MSHKFQDLLDPYVKMNIFQWIIASFATTGKINFRKPRNWASYFFYHASNVFEGDVKIEDEG